MLESWTDEAAKSALIEFAARAVDSVAPEELVAVFDNDGTLWCEKPAYIQLDFLVRRIAEQVAVEPALAANSPTPPQHPATWAGSARLSPSTTTVTTPT